jgi:hypothetical protein
MGRPKTKGHWEELINVWTENEPRLGPLGIRSRLEQAVKEAEAAKVNKDELGPIPSLRTIGRLQRQFRGLPVKERQRYRRFRWPDDMKNGLLPWEAGASALELLRYTREHNYERPLLGQVRWFFRVSTLAPDAPFYGRYEAARQLFAFEAAGNFPTVEDLKLSIELWLAFTPWRSPADAEAYIAALGGKVLGFPYGLWAAMPDFGPDARVLGDFLVAFDPFGIPEEAHRRVAEHYVHSMNSEEEGGSQCEDTSADGGQNGQPSSASGTTKTAGESSSGSAASRPRRQRRKS